LISFAGLTRRRRALVSAFLPYLLLSLFVDFVHLHHLIIGGMTPVSTSQQIKAVPSGETPVPDAPCAICQWLRADTGLQTSTAAQLTFDTIAAPIAALPALTPLRPAFGAPDFRGPPLPRTL
jgi:hypothetical protein